VTKKLKLQAFYVSIRVLLIVHDLVQQWLQNSGVKDQIDEKCT
jgi:hypothetical protein